MVFVSLCTTNILQPFHLQEVNKWFWIILCFSFLLDVSLKVTVIYSNLIQKICQPYPVLSILITGSQASIKEMKGISVFLCLSHNIPCQCFVSIKSRLANSRFDHCCEATSTLPISQVIQGMYHRTSLKGQPSTSMCMLRRYMRRPLVQQYPLVPDFSN